MQELQDNTNLDDVGGQRDESLSRDLLARLHELEMDIGSCETREKLLYWQCVVASNDEAWDRYHEASRACRRLYDEPKTHNLVEEAERNVAQDDVNPLDLRRIEVLKRDLRINRIWEATESRERAHRWAEVVKDAFLLFNPSNPSSRPNSPHAPAKPKSAKGQWEEHALRLRSMVEYRNNAARRLYGSDYYSFMAELHDYNLDQLFDVVEATERVARALLTKHQPQSSEKLWQQWEDCDSQSVVDMVSTYFDSIGLRMHGVIKRSDLLPRPGKDEETVLLDVDRWGDVRIKSSILPTKSSIQTLLACLGRAAYRVNVRPHLPYLLRTVAHPAAEIAAERLFSSLIWDLEWLEEWMGFDQAAMMHDIKEKLRLDRIHTIVSRVLRDVGIAKFERGLYLEPEKSVKDLWNETIGATWPSEDGGNMHESVPEEALNELIDELVCFPLESQHSLLGEVLAWQLRAFIGEELGEGALITSPAAGYVLIDHWFCHGKTYRWDQLVERVFDGQLQPEAMVRGLKGAL